MVSPITKTLLVGTVDDVARPPADVTAILFVAGEHHPTPPAGVLFQRLPLKEFAEASAITVQKAVDWLEQHASTHTILVCCRAGIGRSVSMIVAYLCCAKDMQYTDAIALVTSRRPGATPLPKLESTIEQIRGLRRLRSATTARIRRAGPPPRS